jgi:hypothetical protein
MLSIKKKTFLRFATFNSVTGFVDNNIKKKLNSDGHQLHQYQQNEQSPFIFTH